jgi:hypothetical protein
MVRKKGGFKISVKRKRTKKIRERVHNIPRYIDTFEEEAEIDLVTV